MSEWIQDILIGGKKRGRPRSDNPLLFHSVGLTRSEWEWLANFFPSGSKTDQLSEFVRWGQKFRYKSNPFSGGEGAEALAVLPPKRKARKHPADRLEVEALAATLQKSVLLLRAYSNTAR